MMSIDVLTVVTFYLRKKLLYLVGIVNFHQHIFTVLNVGKIIARYVKE